jgi:hypothetical protein
MLLPSDRERPGCHTVHRNLIPRATIYRWASFKMSAEDLCVASACAATSFSTSAKAGKFLLRGSLRAPTEISSILR